MQYNELGCLKPFMHLATAAGNRIRLAEALRSALGGEGAYSHYTIVQGAPSSTRLFLQAPFDDAILAPRGHRTPEEVAEGLLDYAVEEGGARYPEPAPPDKTKGWKLSCLKVNGKMAVLAEAVWI